MTDLSDGQALNGVGPFVVLGDKHFHAAGLVAVAHPALVGSDRVEDLQRALAYSAARSDIEWYCRPIADGGKGPGAVLWRDSSAVATDDAAHVELALRYLSAVGLLCRHAGNPEWVRVLDLPEVVS